MKNRFYFGPALSIFGFIFFVYLSGCNNANKGGVTDYPSVGTIHISVDESFKPVIEEEIKVYEASYPGTKIIAHYKTEADCFRDLYSDTLNRLIIVTRGLNKNEDRFYNDSLGFSPVSDRIANDAITIIVNNNNTDTLYSIDRLQKLFSGKLGTSHPVVFDGLNATSTVRFAMDSILRGVSFDPGVVKAVKNSAAVIEFVADNPDAIGMLGISWIGNPEDSAQVRMLKKVKISYVKCDYCVDTPYVKPTQSSIITKRYPLVRGLYYIVKENYSGLGSGFVAFLKFERGQLIFRRAYLAPVMDFGIRSVKINEKL